MLHVLYLYVNLYCTPTEDYNFSMTRMLGGTGMIKVVYRTLDHLDSIIRYLLFNCLVHRGQGYRQLSVILFVHLYSQYNFFWVTFPIFGRRCF